MGRIDGACHTVVADLWELAKPGYRPRGVQQVILSLDQHTADHIVIIIEQRELFQGKTMAPRAQDHRTGLEALMPVDRCQEEVEIGDIPLLLFPGLPYIPG